MTDLSPLAHPWRHTPDERGLPNLGTWECPHCLISTRAPFGALCPDLVAAALGRVTTENQALKRTINECVRASPVTTVAFDGNVPVYISSCFEAIINNLATVRAERANLAAQLDLQRARADRMESDAHELRAQLDRANAEIVVQLGKPNSKKREDIPPMRVLVTRDESGNLQTTHLPPVKS